MRIENGSAGRAFIRSRVPGPLRPLRRHNQLQQFLGVAEQLVRSFRTESQRARRQLRRHRGLGDRRIRRDEAHFVHLNVRIILQRGLELLPYLRGLHACSGREGFHEFGEAGFRNLGRKMKTGDPRVGKQPREAFFRRSPFQGLSIQQELVAGDGQQQARLFFPGAERHLQLTPGGFVLRGGSRMPEVIHLGELQQNIKAAHEGARRSHPSVCLVFHEIPPCR